jgi:hypothetical protein
MDASSVRCKCCCFLDKPKPKHSFLSLWIFHTVGGINIMPRPSEPSFLARSKFTNCKIRVTYSPSHSCIYMLPNACRFILSRIMYLQGDKYDKGCLLLELRCCTLFRTGKSSPVTGLNKPRGLIEV